MKDSGVSSFRELVIQCVSVVVFSAPYARVREFIIVFCVKKMNIEPVKLKRRPRDSNLRVSKL